MHSNAATSSSVRSMCSSTDYPFGPQQGEYWAKDTLEQIKGTNLPNAEKDMILGGNLVRLIRRG
jgi:hypothetical protein